VHACEAISQIPEIFELIESDGFFVPIFVLMSGSAKTEAFYEKSKRRRGA
jgi:hypothetical protein